VRCKCGAEALSHFSISLDKIGLQGSDSTARGNQTPTTRVLSTAEAGLITTIELSTGCAAATDTYTHHLAPVGGHPNKHGGLAFRCNFSTSVAIDDNGPPRFLKQGFHLGGHHRSIAICSLHGFLDHVDPVTILPIVGICLLEP
jgi:hypothetical protein